MQSRAAKWQPEWLPFVGSPWKFILCGRCAAGLSRGARRLWQGCYRSGKAWWPHRALMESMTPSPAERLSVVPRRHCPGGLVGGQDMQAPGRQRPDAASRQLAGSG